MTENHFHDLVDTVTDDTLHRLADLTAPCVSIYLPTNRAHQDLSHDSLVLRGLAEDAAAELAAAEIPDSLTEQILSPVRQLVDDRPFWAEQGEGLAVFADRNGHHEFRLRTSPPPMAVVGAHPRLAPILPAVTGADGFFVLAVSLGDVRLFSATTDSIRQWGLGTIPASVDEMERRHQRENQLQHQHEPPASSVATFHGHGGSDAAEVVRDHFLREVATGLRQVIGADNRRPVVVAAVAEYLPVLLDMQLIPGLLEQGIPGNHDATTPMQLLELSRPLVEEAGAARAETDIERCSAALASGKASVDLADIASAAQQGRVDTLFLPPVVPSDQNSDLSFAATDLDAACVAALRTGADLRPVDAPLHGAPAVALLRY
ncbi:hypothetical protein [Austwickia chelonae]|uniref:baeRF3 domain-containing protein n=1 Tax=Austwickia chelonae TaxID=100225 RepID=UPI000E248A7E|nr:hypothetical protein [Austwickia chelonae]